MHPRTLSVLLALCSLAGCGERLDLEDTGISVEIPRGFELNTSVHSSWPDLIFELPPFAANGMRDLFPRIELSLAHGHSIKPKQPDEYLFSRRKDLHDRLFFGPVSTTVDGRPAVEVAIRSQLVAMGGGAVDLIVHDIEFLHGTGYYVCRLTVYPDQYGRYVDDLRDFCKTVRFSKTES